jgi:AraC-like DNA-binding protein
VPESARPVSESARPVSEPAGLVSESARAAPAVPLRGLIGWYSGYRQQGVPPARHRGLPSPYLTLIITLDDPLTVARHPDPADRPGDYRTLVGGLHTTPALISHPGRQSGVQVQLSPLGARALLGLPAGELAGRDLAADDVLGGVAAELHERMRAAADWPARFAILDQVLLARADLDQQVSPDIAEAWRLLVRSGGQIRAAELADHVGWSPRYLQQRLRTETGLTPKAAARVTRFDRARRILQRQAASGTASVPGSAAAAGGAAPTSASGGAVVTLADVAAGCGYYDQAHLAREFRALAGCPPAVWLADEFRNVQSSAGDLDADWLT